MSPDFREPSSNDLKSGDISYLKGAMIEAEKLTLSFPLSLPNKASHDLRNNNGRRSRYAILAGQP